MDPQVVDAVEGHGFYTPDTINLEDYDSPRLATEQSGDFARLIPYNYEAKLAFSSIIERLKLDVECHSHTRQYMHVEDTQSILLAWQESDSDEKSDTGTMIWTGHYRFNLELLPQNPAIGWVIGSGRKELPNDGIDFLLSLDKRKHQIHGIHARLAHHPESLALMIYVGRRKRVSVDAEDVMDSQRQITSVSTKLTLGLLEYKLDFTLFNEDRYRQQLQLLNRRFSHREDLAFSLDLTPSDAHYEFHGFLIQAPRASGAYGVVSAGTEILTGRAVVVKRLKRTKTSLNRIKLEISIYKSIGLHDNLSELMAEVYSGGDANSMHDSVVNDVYLIHRPLARESFVELALSSQPQENRLILLHQALRGLAHLHLNGIMHRDIKPSNLMVVSYEPLHAIVIDFGDATFQTTSTDHLKGTLAYLAPEVLTLKRTSRGDPYSKSVDIWAFGLCVYQIIYKAECTWRSGMEESIYNDVLQTMSSQCSISGLIKGMLAWNPSSRPQAQDLLRSTIWPARDDLRPS